eukprot:306229_1
MGIFLILTTLILIKLVIQLCTVKHIRKWHRYMTLISALFNTLCSSCDLIHIVWCFIINGTLVSHVFDEIIVASDVFYYIGDLALYILLISRIHYTFQNTLYAVRKCTLTFFAVLICVSALCAAHYCIVIVVIKDEDQVIQYNIPAVTTLEITDLILNMSLIVLFIWKLKQLATFIHDIENSNELSIQTTSPMHPSSIFTESEKHSKRKITAKASLQINNKQNNLIILITKHTVLGSIVVVTNQCYWIGYMIVSYLLHAEESDGHVAFVYGIRVFENFMNVLVLYLALTINRKYYRNLCFFCDNCCYKCILKETKDKMMKQIAIKLGTSTDDNYEKF